MKDWITVAEASQRLDVSERSVRTWIAEDKLKARKHGRKWLISEESMGSYGGEIPETTDDTEEVSANSEAGSTQDLEKLRIENEYLKAEVEELRKDKQDLQDSRIRQDTIIMQLSRNAESQQLMLEDMRSKKSFWQRWRRKKDQEDPGRTI